MTVQWDRRSLRAQTIAVWEVLTREAHLFELWSGESLSKLTSTPPGRRLIQVPLADDWVRLSRGSTALHINGTWTRVEGQATGYYAFWRIVRHTEKACALQGTRAHLDVHLELAPDTFVETVQICECYRVTLHGTLSLVGA